MPAAAGPACAAGPSVAAADVAAASAAAGESGAPPGPGWVKMEGEFASVMCVVTSCISEKSRQGLMPEAHLADGRLALVMVERCSRLQYLRFLIQLASKGIVPGSLPFVKVLYATEVQVGRSEDLRASLRSCPACRSLQPHKLHIGLRVSTVTSVGMGGQTRSVYDTSRQSMQPSDSVSCWCSLDDHADYHDMLPVALLVACSSRRRGSRAAGTLMVNCSSTEGSMWASMLAWWMYLPGVWSSCD